MRQVTRRKLLATPAALKALEEADVDIIDLVERHNMSFQ